MTIYDIAKEAGVSITTVSRVINQKPGVKFKTKEKVQRILEKYNYIPNPAAKELAAKSSKIIAIITEDVRDEHYCNTVFTVEQEFSKRGYNSLLINTGKEIHQRIECIERVMNKQIAGAVFIGSTFEEKYIEKAIKKYLPKTPIVIANGCINLSNVCNVMCNGKMGVEMAVDYLVKKGNEHIAYVGTTNTASAVSKRSGYVSSMENNNLKVIIEVPEGDLDIYNGRTCTANVISKYPEVTAIIYEQDLLALGGVQYLTREGIKVPDNVNIIGFNNSIFSQLSVPSITSIDDKIGVMGVKCAQSIMDMIEYNYEPNHMIVLPELIHRDSTR